MGAEAGSEGWTAGKWQDVSPRGPATCEEPDETTWIWSDLHLGDEMSLEVFDRSFRTAHEADRAMMNATSPTVPGTSTAGATACGSTRARPPPPRAG